MPAYPAFLFFLSAKFPPLFFSLSLPLSLCPRSPGVRRALIFARAPYFSRIMEPRSRPRWSANALPGNELKSGAPRPGYFCGRREENGISRWPVTIRFGSASGDPGKERTGPESREFRTVWGYRLRANLFSAAKRENSVSFGGPRIASSPTLQT